MRIRRVLPVWLVLASLALGLLATAASVPIASWYFVHRIYRSWSVTYAWKVRIDHDDYYEHVTLVNSIGFEAWWTKAFEHPGWYDIMHSSIEPSDDRRPEFARAPYPGHEHEVDCYRSGWPMLAAEGRAISGSPSGTAAGHARRADWLMTVWTQRLPVDIPLRPIWKGVLGNTLFYAAPTLALLAATRLGLLALRARRRRTLGRCAHCGYEPGEGDTVCPECGRGPARP